MLARDLVYYMLAAVYLFVCFMLCNNRIVNEYSYALRHPHRVSLLRFVWMLLVYVQRTNPTIASTRFLLNSLLFAQFVVAFVYVICICNGIARRSHRSLSSLNPNGIERLDETICRLGLFLFIMLKEFVYYWPVWVLVSRINFW